MNDDRVMRRRVAKFLFPVFFMSLAFNIPKFFEAQIEYRDELELDYMDEDYGDHFEGMSNGTNLYFNDTIVALISNNYTDLEPVSVSRFMFNVLTKGKFFNIYFASILQNLRPQIQVSELRTHPWYSTYNTWSRFFVLGLIPFLLLLFFNIKIYRYAVLERDKVKKAKAGAS